jgi:hypothetical protein
VVLNVYVLEQLPSTHAHYAELQKLTKDTWLKTLEWSLVTVDGREIALPRPTTLTSSARQRGPAAASIADRDAAVPTTTYRARLSFGSVPAGDYVLQAKAAGLTSRFPFVVRTGSEPTCVTTTSASKRSARATMRSSERCSSSACNEMPIASLHCTISLTAHYFDRAIAAAEKARGAKSDPKTVKQIDDGILQLRAAKESLPQYYANKTAWTMSRDPKKGHYVIQDRRSKAVIRDFAAIQ